MSEEQLISTPSVFGETGNFLLERELGKGGMGGVYMGRDKMLDRPVAVKVMLKEYGSDIEFIERFKHEAQAAARLIHPNIAQVYSYGIADGMPYIAMELVAGGSLDQLMKLQPGKIDIPRVMKICEQVAQALRCSADQGLVHGDIKPENVLLDANGNAKIVDFGLAAMQKNTDEIWGTPYYIAPEKVKKEPVDYRADMYSLGGTIYHALTGVAPFEGDDAAAVVRKRFEGNPVPPSAHRPEITPQIDALVLKMLALNPADRFPTFEALLEEFRRVMSTGLDAAPAAVPAAGASAGTGGRRVVMKTRKRFKTVSRPAESSAPDDNEGLVRDLEPEESGGVGRKVLMVVALTVLAISLVAGLLAWAVIANKRANEEAERRLGAGKITEARKAIVSARDNALKFAENIDAAAEKSVAECQKTTDRLKRELDGKFDESLIAMIKPAPTAELMAAIALTNVIDEAALSNGLAAVAAELGNALGGAMNEMAKEMVQAVKAITPVLNIPKFRDPEEDEADPMSPAHAEYMKEKAKWEAEQKEKALREAEAKAAAAKEAAENAAQPQDAPKKDSRTAENEILVTVIRDMSDLWSRAYSCQAAAIRIRHGINGIVNDIDAARFDGENQETLDKIAPFTSTIRDRFDQIKASDDVTKIQKGTSYIRTKGGNTITRTVNNLLVAQREREREEAAANARQEEEERQAQLAADKAATIERDNAAIKEKFDSLQNAGVFRQLDWKGALRQLKVIRDDFKFAESQVYADTIIQKVEMMKTVQDVFIANCRDYVFNRSKMRNCKIADISEKEIKLVKPDGKTPAKLTWVRFYSQFHSNLNELIIKFIEKGKMVSKLPDGKRLGSQRWADAMMGAALTMQVICGDDPTVADRSAAIVKEAVKQFPDYLKRAQEIFPEVSFEGIEE